MVNGSRRGRGLALSGTFRGIGQMKQKNRFSRTGSWTNYFNPTASTNSKSKTIWSSRKAIENNGLFLYLFSPIGYGWLSWWAQALFCSLMSAKVSRSKLASRISACSYRKNHTYTQLVDSSYVSGFFNGWVQHWCEGKSIHFCSEYGSIENIGIVDYL